MKAGRDTEGMAAKSHQFIAIDLGASNGRVVLGTLDRGRLRLEIAHRFAHQARDRAGQLSWDWPHIIASVRRGLAAAAEMADGEPITSVSCDSWAQDFGLLDEAGRLLFAPVSYRDPRTAGMPESFADIITPDELVRRVGSLAAPITTLCQLKAMAQQEPELLQQADTLLHIADLVHYDLCGQRMTDRSLATVSQLRNLETGSWDLELLAMLDIPHHYLPEVAEVPTAVGQITADQAPQANLRGTPVVIAVGHDTATASAILPPADEGVVCLMSGTWSMLGCATDELLVPEKPAQQELAIFGLAHGRWGLFRAIMGLWLVQECRRAWRAAGRDMSFAEITETAQKAAAPVSVIDPDASCFLAPDDMPSEIQSFCAQSGQPVPQTPGEIARVVFTSLALAYRLAIEQLGALVGKRVNTLRIVGGGSANELLCQLAADAAGLPVIAGPTEATAIGNILLQAQVAGVVESPADMIRIVTDSFLLRRYEPRDALGEDLYEKFAALKRSQGQ